jgi:putative ATP-dependent endonuclease of the OLD family
LGVHRGLAVAVFFGSHRATEDDLHVDAMGNRAPRFVIDMRFIPSSGTEFGEDIQARFLGKIQIPIDPKLPQFFTMRAIGQASPDGSGIALDRRFLKGWAEGRPEATTLQLLPERPGREHLELVSFFLLDARRDLVEELRTRTSHWGRLLADLDIAAGARMQIEQALEALGKEIVESSPVLSSVRAGLKGVKEALGGSVSDVAIAPVPDRMISLTHEQDELARLSASCRRSCQ